MELCVLAWPFLSEGASCPAVAAGTYSGQFDTVEVNNTFYRLPERSSLRAGVSRCRLDSSSQSKPAAT